MTLAERAARGEVSKRVDSGGRASAAGVSSGVCLPPIGGGGRLVQMADSLREQVLGLSAAERLELVEILWDRLDDDDPALALTDAQRADLERRLAAADADPEGGSPWAEVQERIRNRRSR